MTNPRTSRYDRSDSGTPVKAAAVLRRETPARTTIVSAQPGLVLQPRPVNGGMSMTATPAPVQATWMSLTRDDIRCAVADPVIDRAVRDLVREAVNRNEHAIRILADTFRWLFHARITRVSLVTDPWWERKELAAEFLAYLVTGLRPSLRTAEPERSDDGKGRADRRTAPSTSTPLAAWLAQDEVPLWDFVSARIGKLCIDLVRRGYFQKKLGIPREHGDLDLRSDADSPQQTEFVPGRDNSSSTFAPERDLVEKERDHLIGLALETLTAQERQVLTAIMEDRPQTEIAATLGVSGARVSTIKTAAIAKMQQALAELGLLPEKASK